MRRGLPPTWAPGVGVSAPRPEEGAPGHRDKTCQPVSGIPRGLRGWAAGAQDPLGLQNQVNSPVGRCRCRAALSVRWTDSPAQCRRSPGQGTWQVSSFDGVSAALSMQWTRGDQAPSPAVLSGATTRCTSFCGGCSVKAYSLFIREAAVRQTLREPYRACRRSQTSDCSWRLGAREDERGAHSWERQVGGESVRAL